MAFVFAFACEGKVMKGKERKGDDVDYDMILILVYHDSMISSQKPHYYLNSTN